MTNNNVQDFFSSFRWIPESARWLLANGKVKEAKKYLVQCAIMNGKYGYAAKLDTEVSQPTQVHTGDSFFSV